MARNPVLELIKETHEGDTGLREGLAAGILGIGAIPRRPTGLERLLRIGLPDT